MLLRCNTVCSELGCLVGQHDRKVSVHQRRGAKLPDRFRQCNALDKFSFGAHQTPHEERTPSGREMSPRPALARVKPISNLEFILGIFESSLKIAFVYRVLAQKLVARRLRKQYVVFYAEFERRSRPTISLDVESIMLVAARKIGVNLRDN